MAKTTTPKTAGKTKGEQQKPQPAIVKIAAKAMTHPEDVTRTEIKKMAARLLDDQRNDPQPHKPIKPNK